MKSLRVLMNILFALFLVPCAMFAVRGIQLTYNAVSVDDYHRAALDYKGGDTTPGLVMLLGAIFSAAIIVVVRKLLFIWIERQDTPR
jgi:NADH:ubiquinone oxidoreductase subunit 5 (subunit L)/multisubunit Na+/H+ antiporter MnhA subunit